MTPRGLSALCAFALALWGCPTAPSAPVDDPSLDLPPGPESSSEAQEVTATTPPPAGEGDALPADMSKLTFARYITPATTTVTLHVVIKGMDHGQIDFTSFEGGSPGNGRAELIHLQRFETDTFDIVAPANFDRKLFVSASTVGEEGVALDQGEVASTSGPVVIGSEDQTVTLVKDSQDGGSPSIQPSGKGPGKLDKPPPEGGQRTPGGQPPAGEQPAAGEAPAQP